MCSKVSAAVAVHALLKRVDGMLFWQSYLVAWLPLLHLLSSQPSALAGRVLLTGQLQADQWAPCSMNKRNSRINQVAAPEAYLSTACPHSVPAATICSTTAARALACKLLQVMQHKAAS